MKTLRRVGIVLLLAAVLVLGFLLPTIVGRVQDAQTDQRREAVSANRVQLDMASPLTLLQKMRIYTEAVSSVELDSPQQMDERQALDALMSGLDDLFSLNLEELPFAAEGFSEVSHTIRLKIMDEDSLIYWEFWLMDSSSNQIVAAVDDDTGLILSLQYTLGSTFGEEVPEEDPMQPDEPLFSRWDVSFDTESIFFLNGIFAGLEDIGSSAEEFAALLQNQYCNPYLWKRGYRFHVETNTEETEDNSYSYSVLLVDDAGGYYVLPFVVTNSEFLIN